ncbi:CynX/NimT family MFS transporter [Aliiglaciecola sp. SL4]|uniref:MFS transporter n=1 Tax=Aliiglaciecola sp. SL4 TaxID=3239806 RepID=UPI00355C769A
MGKLSADKQAWFVLCTFSLSFFVVTAATFTSLGVILPAMVTELGWDWTTAGLGFTLLGVACGLSGYLPTITVRRWGVATTLIIGLILLAIGFIVLYLTTAPITYFLGCILTGTGYTFVGSVPGTYIITHFFKRRSTAFGFYYTVGGLGGVVGPIVVWMATNLLGNWRLHWLVMLAAIIVSVGLMLLSLLFTDANRLRTPPKQELIDTEKQRVYETEQTWTFKQAIRTPQYILLMIAYSTVLFVGITVNSFSVAHMTEVGITFALASTLLSAEAFCNAISRVVGGFIGEFFDPKVMLQIALLLLAGGMFALSFGQSLIILGFFAFAIGFGFGLTFLSCTVLLVRYFGTGPYLPLFSLMNIGATVASAAPILSGRMRDISGTFVPPFVLIGILPMLVLVGIAFMRPPRLKEQKVSEPTPSDPSINNMLAAKVASK